MKKLWSRGLGSILVATNCLLLCNTAQSVVGYVNMDYPEGWTLIANPLTTGGNTLNELGLSNLPEGSQISKWNGSSYQTFLYHSGDWFDQDWNAVGSSITLAPGVGAVLHTTNKPQTVTYVGEVVSLPGEPTRIPATPPVGAGVYLLSSTFPTASSFADIVGRPPNDGESVLTINPLGEPIVSLFDAIYGEWGGGGVDPVAGPSIGIGYSAFFALNGGDFSNWSLPSIVPEPCTLTLLALGTIILFRRRK